MRLHAERLLGIDRGAAATAAYPLPAPATALRPRLQPGDEVASYRDYFQDLPFYLGRKVAVAAWRGELD